MARNRDYSEGVPQAKKTNWSKVLLPVIAIILAAIAAGIALFAVSGTDAVMTLIADAASQPEIATSDEWKLLVGGVIWVVIIIVFSAVGAIFAPRPPKIATEAHLAKERDEKAKEEAARKRRKKEMREKMRAAQRRNER